MARPAWGGARVSPEGEGQSRKSRPGNREKKEVDGKDTRQLQRKEAGIELEKSDPHFKKSLGLDVKRPRRLKYESKVQSQKSSNPRVKKKQASS